MSKSFRIFSSIANLIVGIVLTTSIAETRIPNYDYGHDIVLSILRSFLSLFLFLSEIPPLKQFYLHRFNFFMFPLGRSLMYAFLSILSFNLMLCGVINIIIIGIITVITFILALRYKRDGSPYMSINRNGISNNNPESVLPYHQSSLNEKNILTIPKEVDIKIISN